MREVNPHDTKRAYAFEMWMNAPMPMVTFFKTYDVMPLIKVSKSRGMKFNMLLDFCIGKAAVSVHRACGGKYRRVLYAPCWRQTDKI